MNKTFIVKFLLPCIVFTFSQVMIAGNYNTLQKTHKEILEVVILSSKPTFTTDQVSKAANGVTAILRSYPGFLSRKFSENVKRKNQWIDIVYWSSLQNALAASNKIIKTPQMKKFMSIIKSYKIYHFQIKFEASK